MVLFHCICGNCADGQRTDGRVEERGIARDVRKKLDKKSISTEKFSRVFPPEKEQKCKKSLQISQKSDKKQKNYPKTATFPQKKLFLYLTWQKGG